MALYVLLLEASRRLTLSIDTTPPLATSVELEYRNKLLSTMIFLYSLFNF